MKRFSQDINLDLQGRYGISDFNSVVLSDINLDINSPNIEKYVVSIYCMVNYYNSMENIDILNNYTFERTYQFNSENFIGHGTTNGDTSIICIFGQENRETIIKNFFYLTDHSNPSTISSNLTTFKNNFYNPQYYIEALSNIHFTLKDKVILISQGNQYPINELIINTLLSGKTYKSYCYNPGRSLKKSDYKSTTKFYFYDNPYSDFIPETITETSVVNKKLKQENEVKLFLPMDTNFITYTNFLPSADTDKVFPMFFAYNYLKGYVNVNTLPFCQNYFELRNLTIPEKFIDSPVIDVYTDLSEYVNIIIKSYISNIPNKFSIQLSSNKNLMLILDNDTNNSLLYLNKTTNTVITGVLEDMTINGHTFQIDTGIIDTDLDDEILDFKNIIDSLDISKQLMIIGMNTQIYYYLKLLNITNLSKTSVYSLGLTSITKGFIGFDNIGYVNYKIFNIFNDLVILKTTQEKWGLYDPIKSDVIYDINADDQICLNTIFGYSKYLNI